MVDGWLTANSDEEKEKVSSVILKVSSVFFRFDYFLQRYASISNQYTWLQN